MGQWTLELQTFRDHVTEIVLKDENGIPLDVSGWFLKVDIEHTDGTITWSSVTGHIVIAAPTSDGKATLTVTKTEIATLPFDWAAFSFYAGANAGNPDLIYEGKAKRS
ncbi:MAG: hypothetical protein IT174_10750 [Acidobacteria bacterium]|nr:hypothetical protein [Acidobacteriota bacterium]